MVQNSISNVTLPMVYEKLVAIERQLNRPKLGFSGDRGLRYVYAQLTNGNRNGWYELLPKEDGSQEARTLPPIYWGVPYNLDFKTVQRQGDKSKFRLWMLAEDDLGEELTIFESGSDTFFAKTLMAAVSKLTIEQLRQPLRLKSYIKEIQSGKNQGSKTLGVYPSFGDGDENRIDAPWKNSDNWRQIALQAINNIRTASGYVPREEREQNQAA